MKKYDLVVARYNEDLSWINQLEPEKFNLKIYNKGEKNIDFNFVQLDNLGRDPHTFIMYIIQNYENLPEYVIFLQGDPVCHHKNVISIINNHTEEPYVCLSDHVIEESIFSWYEHLVDTKVPDPYPNMKRFGLHETAYSILKDETPGICVFAAGQQYIVNKKFILNRDKKFYIEILERFKFDYVLPWHIERLWFYIWNLK